MQWSKKVIEGSTSVQKDDSVLDKYLIWFAAVLMLAISIVHVLPPYNADIINYDSAYQYFLTRHSMSDIALLLPEDYSPPLYTILLKGWTYIFGETLGAMRAFSVVIMWGLIFLAAFPIRKAINGRASLLCMLFYTLSSVNFLLVPEIRPTILAYFFVAAAAVYSYLAYFYGYRYAYICLTVFSILAMYTHNAAMLAVLSFYAGALLMSLFGKKMRQALYFFISGCVCALCYIPWLIIVVKQFANVKKNYWSNDDISLEQVIDWTYGVHFSSTGHELFCYAFIAAVAITVIIAVLKLRKYTKVSELITAAKSCKPYAVKFIFGIWLYIGPIAALIIFSAIAHPIIAPRYFYIFGSVLVMMISAFLGKFAGRKTYAAFIAVIVLNFCTGMYEVKKSLDEADFIDMIEQVRMSENDEIAFLHIHEWSLGIMMYYFPDADHYVCDDTWCVLNTLDVFPTEVKDIGDIENISEYETNFYVFGGEFPDSPYELDNYFMEDDRYKVTYLGDFSEPYTYKKRWSLYNVSLGV